MTPFAGIVAIDGPLPTSMLAPWLEALRRRVGDLPVHRSDDALLVGHLGSGDAPTLCDARIDHPAVTPGEVARLLSTQLDGARDGAPFEPAGEFAIARWTPGQRELLLAADPLGFRTLHVAEFDGCVAFATDLPALLAFPAISRRLATLPLADRLLAAGGLPPGTTVYEAIRQVPAGHQWRFGPGGTAPRPWRRPDPAPSAEDAPSALRRLLEEAVRCRIPAQGRVGVHLSGGLDSSAIACIAARQLRAQGRRLVALCAVNPPGQEGPEEDERAHIEAVLAQEDNIDVAWVAAAPGEVDVLDTLTPWFDLLGAPPFVNVTHAVELLGRAARAHGADVVLSGFGGDLFASINVSRTVPTLLGERQWRDAWSELRAQSRAHGWRQAVGRELVQPLKRWWHRGVPPARQTVVRGDVLEGIRRTRDFTAGDAVRRMMALEPRDLMRFVLLPGHLDQVVSPMVQYLARAHGQSLRMPLLDTRVIDFMQRVPIRELHRDGVPRALFRRATEGLLPESVRQRRDKGAPFDPSIMSRLVACRPGLRAWADDATRPCWRFLDRATFLAELARVVPAARSAWRPETIPIVVMGMTIGRFIDWHAEREAHGWN